mgnify:FL=1
MPRERFIRYTSEYGLPEEDAELIISDKAFSDFYDETVKINTDYKQVSNMMLGEVSHLLNDSGKSIADVKFSPADVAETVKMASDGKISVANARETIAIMFEKGGKPEQIAEENGFIMSSSTDGLEEIIDKVISENGDSLEKYKAGNDKLFGFFMGQTMRAAGKSANPKLIKDLLTKKLDG